MMALAQREMRVWGQEGYRARGARWMARRRSVRAEWQVRKLNRMSLTCEILSARMRMRNVLQCMGAIVMQRVFDSAPGTSLIQAVAREAISRRTLH